jgi:hypothetical protein
MAHANTEAQPSRFLSSHEIDAVSGGMKWVRGTSNPDVIDARGGSFVIFGWRITKDSQGKVSSVTKL